MKKPLTVMQKKRRKELAIELTRLEAVAYAYGLYGTARNVGKAAKLIGFEIAEQARLGVESE